MSRPLLRNAAIPTLLICTSALADCASSPRPPAIHYDTIATVAAVKAPDPPKPVQVVAVPTPLPLPGQLKPLPAQTGIATNLANPAKRVAAANAAARVQPGQAGFINAIQQYPWTEGALYQVYASPGAVTDIALQEGEQLTGSGPVAAGDTVRWIIGDTISGAGPTQRVHILIKPTMRDLTTNLVINTDRRTYHLELRATSGTYLASVSWSYPQDQLIALKGKDAAAVAMAPAASGIDVDALNFRYTISGDDPPWRPLRAFDDGRQVFIEFSAGIVQGEMPPLFVVGPAGGGELVNYRVSGHHMIVDRLFAAAELKMGDKNSARTVRISRVDGKAR